MVVLIKLTQQDSSQNWIYMEVYGEAEIKFRSLTEDQPCEDSVRSHWVFHRQCFPPFSFLTSGFFPASFHRLSPLLPHPASVVLSPSCITSAFHYFSAVVATPLR